MYRQTGTLTYSRAFINTVLAAYKTVPGGALITTLTVRLLKGTLPAITPDTLLADLVALEADFSGYAAGTPTMSAPVRLSNGSQAVIGSTTFIVVTATPLVTNTVTGYFLTDGTNLVGAEAFSVPNAAPMANVGDFLAMDVALPGTLYQAAA